MIQGTIHQEEVIVLKIYAPNIDAPNFIKQTHMDPNNYPTFTNKLPNKIKQKLLY